MDLKNKVMHTGFLTRDIDGVWMVKWSDLHSFTHGTHWCYTYLSDDSNVIKSIEDDTVIYKPFKEETEVKFEMVIGGYDEKTYIPNQKAKLIFPEVDAFEKEEIIKTYVRDGGELFLITKIDRIRDGGTMVIVTNSSQHDNKVFYVHKDYWTLHYKYPLTDENMIPNDYHIKTYILSKMERYKEHLNTELNQVINIIEKLKL